MQARQQAQQEALSGWHEADRQQFLAGLAGASQPCPGNDADSGAASLQQPRWAGTPQAPPAPPARGQQEGGELLLPQLPAVVLPQLPTLQGLSDDAPAAQLAAQPVAVAWGAAGCAGPPARGGNAGAPLPEHQHAMRRLMASFDNPSMDLLPHPWLAEALPPLQRE
jgi:hypothetical protein